MQFKTVLVTAGLISALAASAEAAELNAAFVAEGPADQAVLTKLTNQFMAAHPGVKVNLQFLSWNPLHDKLATTIPAGAAPDIFTLGDGWEVEFHSALLPLDGAVKGWDQLKDYVPATLAASSYDGKLYGLPYRANPWITVYNGGYFEQAGLDPNRAPDTWDDVSQMAPKLVKKDPSGKVIRSGAIHYGAAASYSFNAYKIRALLGQNGVDYNAFFDPAKLADVARSQQTHEVFDYYASFMRNGWSGHTGNWTQFQAGNTAILVAGQNSEVIGYRTAHPDSAGDARAAIPLMKVQRAAPMPVDKWGIYKDTKNPELAVSYLLYLSSRENLGQFLEALKSIPPRRSMGNLEFMQHDAVMQAYLASLPYGQPLPRSPLTGKVNDAVGKAAGDFVYKNAPFSTVIETMITQIKAALAG